MIYHPTLSKVLLIIQFFTALIAFVFFIRNNKSYWRWFSFYLIFIFIQEVVWTYNPELLGFKKQVYYAFCGIPIQYLFLFWLFAFKSLKNSLLYSLFSIIYIASYLPIELFYKKLDIVYSLNLTIGTLLIAFLAVLEFIKQIRSDDILKFKENKMFYITIGVILFYIGTYPFWVFYDVLSQEPYLEVWNIYYLYFLISNCIMYLLFLASFIWGKTHL